MLKVLITDMRHSSIAQEKAVLEPAGVTLDTTFSETEDALIAHGQEAIGFLVSYAPVTRKVMEALPELKIIVKYGIGVDNIDLRAAQDLGKYVANVPEFCTEEVALHALSLITTGLRMTHYFGGEVKRHRWIEDPTTEAIDRPSLLRFGLAGFGKIARQLATYMEHIVGEIAYVDPYLPQEAVQAIPYTRVETLQQLFAQCQIVSLHTPLTEETRHLIDQDVLAHGRDLILVNTSRGGVIEKYALAQALEAGQVKFFGTDVYWEEPADFADPWNIDFLQRKDVYVTPHVAAYSRASEQELRRKAAEEVLRVIQGQPPLHLVKG
jgi:D-3-phosphoglycerate dehydrogenase